MSEPNVILWAVSNTGGIRTFFNIRKFGASCKISCLRQLQSHLRIVSDLSAVNIINKTPSRFVFGFLYKLLPPTFFKLKAMVKIRAGISCVSLIKDHKTPFIATDIHTLVILILKKDSNVTYYAQHDERLFSDENKFLFKRYEKILKSGKFDLICNSTWLLRELKILWPDKKTSLCLPGVDRASFPKRSPNSYPAIPQKFFSLARPQAWKGTRLLLSAFQMIRREFPNATLTLFGSFDYSFVGDNLPAGISFLHNISDSELAASYRDHDLVINPSFYESSPAPVLEALSSGTPVISTPIGVSDEGYFAECPEAIFAAQDADQLYAKLKEIILDSALYQRLCRASEAYQPRTWADTASNFNQIWSNYDNR
jgi:glycosyltransferase involved in cell wall biosynthesis